jgi:hypothetical protein
MTDDKVITDVLLRLEEWRAARQAVLASADADEALWTRFNNAEDALMAIARSMADARAEIRSDTR